MYYTIRQWKPQGVSLPDAPSDLLELALNDAKRLNRSRYQMDVGRYHESARRRDDDKCGVCLAGAVMARALKAPITADCEPDSIAEDGRLLRQKLQAIDKMREGLILEAVVLARGERFPDVFESDDRERFRALDASLTERQRDVIEKWEMSELGVWPTGPLDWASFDDDEPAYRDMIADLRSVGW